MHARTRKPQGLEEFKTRLFRNWPHGQLTNEEPYYLIVLVLKIDKLKHKHEARGIRTPNSLIRRQASEGVRG